MKISKLKFLGSLLALAGPAAFAQTNISGLSLGGNLGFATTTVEVKTDGGEKFAMGDASNPLDLQLAYTFRLGNAMALTFGGTMQMNETDIGKVAGSNTEIGFNDKMSIINKTTVFVEPGYVAAPGTVIYGKAAVSSMEVEETWNNVGSATTITTTTKFRGFGYGAGFRHLLSPRVYLQAEFLQISYSKEDIGGWEYSPTSTTANVGVGYKF